MGVRGRLEKIPHRNLEKPCQLIRYLVEIWNKPCRFMLQNTVLNKNFVFLYQFWSITSPDNYARYIVEYTFRRSFDFYARIFNALTASLSVALLWG